MQCLLVKKILEKVGINMKKIINYDLKTPEYDLLDKECPLKEYPRPQFKRDSYVSLNGEWDYLISNKAEVKMEPEGN